MLKILNLIRPGDGTGWGICGRYLTRHLPNYCEMLECEDRLDGSRDGLISGPIENHADPVGECDVVLAPVVNSKWSYAPWDVGVIHEAKAKGKKIVGYGFHEFRLMGVQEIQHLADNWDGLACGSRWMEEWVSDALDVKCVRGPNTCVATQGVDKELFRYVEQKRPDVMNSRFVVVSAGKFEYRKGQDIVVEAFRRLKKSAPEAMLVINWENAWPESMRTMDLSRWMKANDLIMFSSAGGISIAGVRKDWIDAEDQLSTRLGPHEYMAEFYRNADAGLFPNRCEAGQSLPAVECAASGTRVIIPAWTGMMDLVSVLDPHCGVLKGGKRYVVDDPSICGFYEPCVEEVLSCLMAEYRSWKSGKYNEDSRLKQSKIIHEEFDWASTASSIVRLCESVVE